MLDGSCHVGLAARLYLSGFERIFPLPGYPPSSHAGSLKKHSVIMVIIVYWNHLLLLCKYCCLLLYSCQAYSN